MFEMTTDQLNEMGAFKTTVEIKQQPELWLDTLNIYKENLEAIEAFLADARAMGEGRLSVVFTGAGTSDYVGDTCAPTCVTRATPRSTTLSRSPRPTSCPLPRDFLNPDEPTVVVSFARSGNSPESLAAVQVAKTFVKNVKFINITCAPEGRLAVESEGRRRPAHAAHPARQRQGLRHDWLLQLHDAALHPHLRHRLPRAEDRVGRGHGQPLGEDVIAREGEIAEFLSCDFNRVTYLGSGSFGGLAQEAQLKILELAHGLVATSYDTSMGYRHGPKSFVDDKTLVFVFVNNDEYTRQYDLDILNEINGDQIAAKTIAIQQDGATKFDGASFTLAGEALPEAYLALPFVMVGQVVSLLNSVRVGNTPDTPSPSGTVNRVVKGVTIHPFEA